MRADPVLLARENARVLDLVQALIGSITHNMRAVSIEVADDGVRLHFVLAEESAADREEIEEIAFAFEALQDQDLQIEVLIRISESLGALELPGRRVYGRKEFG